MDNGFLSNLVLALGSGLLTVAFIIMGFIWKGLHARITRTNNAHSNFVTQPELKDMKENMGDVKTSMDSLSHDLRKHMQVEQYMYLGMIGLTCGGFVVVIAIIFFLR